MTLIRLTIWLFLLVLTAGAASALDPVDSGPAVSRRMADADTRSLLSTLPKNNGYLQVRFEHLSDFSYEFSEEEIFTEDSRVVLARLHAKNQIPRRIRELDGKKATVEGYMIPIDFGEGDVLSFILVPSQQACCYGVPPRINEIVYAKMSAGKKTKYFKDMPIHVWGTLVVGEEIRDGTVFCMYFMEAEKVEMTPEGIQLRNEIIQMQKSLLQTR